MSFSVASLASHLGFSKPADVSEKEWNKPIAAIKPLSEAGPEDLSFLDNAGYKKEAEATKAGTVLVRGADAGLLPKGTLALVTPQPYVAFAQALQLMYPQPPVQPGVSQFAVVSGQAIIHPEARVEPYAVIYAGANIAAGAHIGAHAVIGEGVHVGAGSKIGAHCTLQKVVLGANCLLHPGVRIGQDGFGFAVTSSNGEPEIVKVPQIGRVVIGADVEIGANSTIDCGALGNTVIEDMVKIDNQVQIGHNVHIGKGSRVVSQVGVAGSTKLGRFTVIGGQVGIAGHIEVADRVMVAACSGVTKSITQAGSVVAGIPAVPIQEWRRQMAVLARLVKNVVQKSTEAEAAKATKVEVAEKPAPSREDNAKNPNPFGA